MRAESEWEEVRAKYAQRGAYSLPGRSEIATPTSLSLKILRKERQAQIKRKKDIVNI